MKTATKFSVILLIFFFGILFFAWKYASLQLETVTITFVVACLYGVLWVAILFTHNTEVDLEAEKRKKQQLVYCWMSANAQLSRMEGGVALQWNQGEKSDIFQKEFTDFAGRSKRYYAFRARVGNSGAEAYVYYDIELENVATYKSFPSGQIIIDPFSIWRPFDNSNAQFNTNKYNNQTLRQPSLNLTWGDAQQAQQVPTQQVRPTQSTVDELYKEMQ